MKNIPLLGYLVNAYQKAHVSKYLTPTERALLQAMWGAFFGVIVGSVIQILTAVQQHQYNVLLTIVVAALTAALSAGQKFLSTRGAGDKLVGELLTNLEAQLSSNAAQQVPAPADPQIGGPIPGQA